MIIEHSCIGSVNTAYHDFGISTEGMEIRITSGEYHRKGEILFSSNEDTIVEIPVTDKDIEYTFFLTKDGLVVVEQDLTDYRDIRLDNIIEQLAWFTVHAHTQSLDDIDINVRKIHKDEVGEMM